MQSKLDWDDLRLVLAIGQSAGLSGASRTLGVNHSTVFRRIGRLEAALGVRLFDRLPDGYAPTAAGETVLAVAARFREEVEGLERRLAGEDMRPSGTVRVTTTDTLLALLTPSFAAFRATHPDIALEVVAANTMFSLSRREADVAIRPSASPPDHLVGRRVAEIATAVYAAASLPLQVSRELGAETWIGPDDSLAHLASAGWLRRHYPDARIAYRANSLLGLYEAARAGLGLACLPCFMADPDPVLVRVLPPEPAMASALWLLTHSDLRRVARIRAFMDFMAADLVGQKPLLEGTG